MPSVPQEYRAAARAIATRTETLGETCDIGGLSTNLHPQTGGPTIFIYDGHPSSVGLTRQAYERFEELCRDAHRLIAECPCKSGCPSCVQSPKCGNLNEPLSKAGARMLLEEMLGKR